MREQTQIWVDDYNHLRPRDALDELSQINYRSKSDPSHGLHYATAMPSLHYARVNQATKGI